MSGRGGLGLKQRVLLGVIVSNPRWLIYHSCSAVTFIGPTIGPVPNLAAAPYAGFRDSSQCRKYYA